MRSHRRAELPFLGMAVARVLGVQCVETENRSRRDSKGTLTQTDRLTSSQGDEPMMQGPSLNAAPARQCRSSQ